MKIDPKIIAYFLIGIIVGGLVIGFIDANRSTPLFSPATSTKSK